MHSDKELKLSEKLPMRERQEQIRSLKCMPRLLEGKEMKFITGNDPS
jgi:hypothetical protein